MQVPSTLIGFIFIETHSTKKVKEGEGCTRKHP